MSSALVVHYEAGYEVLEIPEGEQTLAGYWIVANDCIVRRFHDCDEAMQFLRKLIDAPDFEGLELESDFAALVERKEKRY